MKLSIIHLSDAHFTQVRSENSVFSKLDLIVSRVRGELQDVNSVFIVFSGDVASKGIQSEYDVAYSFIQELIQKLKVETKIQNIKVIIVPGNHDCDFSVPDSVRPTLINTLTEDSLKNLQPDFVQTMIKPQEGWRRFAASFGINSDVTSKLLYRIDHQVEDSKIVFNCFNTAWMSTKTEAQGRLLFPVGHSDVIFEGISVSVLHHPYNWFKSSSGMELRDYLEKNSHIILTGHEHVSRGVTQETAAGCFNYCFEGAILQSPQGKNDSGFNHVLLDLKAETIRMISCKWDSDVYKILEDTGDVQFTKANHGMKKKVILNDAFVGDYLTDPGTQFTHRKHGNVRLKDIFIWPNFQRQDFSKKGMSGSNQVDEAEILQQLSRGNTYFVGSSNSGKTTLAKKIFETYYEKLGAFPLLMKGGEIKSCSEDKCRRGVSQAILEQYADLNLDSYLQFASIERVAVVDDFHKIQLNSEGREKFLKFLLKNFGRVVLFGEDFSQFQELVEDNKAAIMSNFDIFEVKELSFLQRSEMIKNWFGYGEDYSSEPAVKTHDLNEKERLVDSILRKNLIPAYPLFVLTILQTIEAGESLKTADGTYGYYYEALITMAIANKISHKHVDKYYTYLAALSHEMYSTGKTELSYEDIVAFTERYRSTYAVTLKTRHMVDDFVGAKILVEQSARYSFKYKYLYFYFVARYISQNLDSVPNQAAIKDQIREMAKTVYTGDSANILIFLSYLSKNPFIQEQIIENSKEIFKGKEECDLEKTAHFIFQTPVTKPLVELDESKNVEAARKEDLIKRDKQELCQSKELQRIPESQRGGMAQINIAFKTVEILGQIVRNFSGSLPAEHKIRLVEECYSLGLRSLTMFLDLIKNEATLIRTILKDSLEKRGKKYKTEEELNEVLNTYMFYLGQAIIHSFVKRISYAIGSNELEEVYRRVLVKHSNSTYKLLDIAVRIEHLLEIPHKDIISFYKEIEHNVVMSTNLKIVVIEHFYLFPCDRNIRTKICDTLEIRRNSPKMLETSGKKFGQGG